MCQGGTGIQLALQELQGKSAEIKGTCKTPRELTESRQKRAVKYDRYQKAKVWRWEGTGSGPGEGMFPLAAGRHGDISPPVKGPKHKVISAVLFSKCCLC